MAQINQKNVELDLWSLYLYALKSPSSREKYSKRLEKYFDYLGLDGSSIEEKSLGFVGRLENEGNDWVFNSVLKYMQILLDRVNRKEITGATVRNHLKSIKLYCDMADIPITWKKISRGLPKGKNYADDRIPTTTEMIKLLEYPDRRIKAIVYTMCSSGIRLGAWDYLKWGHIRPIIRKGKDNIEIVIAAKILVYAGEDEEYASFISSEAYQSLKDWMDYRKNSGELIDDNSWLMRDLWDTRVAQGRGFITAPQKLAASGIKRLIERAIWAQGLRKKLEKGKKRHPFSAIHSMRKWFKTRCEIGGMKPINVEMLLCHNIGISGSYYRPTENELLDDFLKVSKHLIVQENNNNDDLKREIDELLYRNETNENTLKVIQQQKDDAYITLSDQVMKLMEEVQLLKMNKT